MCGKALVSVFIKLLSDNNVTSFLFLGAHLVYLLNPLTSFVKDQTLDVRFAKRTKTVMSTKF